ncbi:hypothetical protein HC891_06960 [Candidatus Gracilibacteria bacterium]|nr:hypothetical protein [Candidatus Gracilibacteria bacterium]
MSASTDATIASAILHHLAAAIGSGPTARAFVRVEGFNEISYRHLLDTLAEQQWRLAGRALLVRSIVPVEGHPAMAMEAARSATWYRNNLPADHTLLLILNRRTSDAQSLQDLYAIGEQTLTRDGLGELIGASFAGYQLDGRERRVLIDFVRRLRRLRLEPQLRDLAEFLRDIDIRMQQRPGTPLQETIAEASGARPISLPSTCRTYQHAARR